MNTMYEIEALKDFEEYDFLKYCVSENDSYTLMNINSFLKNSENPKAFKNVLIAFYENYSGKKETWIRFTMDIVYIFENPHADFWLMRELEKFGKNEMTPYAIITLHKHRIENRKGTLEKIIREIAKKSPYSYTYLDRIRKEMNIR